MAALDAMFDADDPLLAECAAKVLAHAARPMLAHCAASKQAVPKSVRHKAGHAGDARASQQQGVSCSWHSSAVPAFSLRLLLLLHHSPAASRVILRFSCLAS